MNYIIKKIFLLMLIIYLSSTICYSQMFECGVEDLTPEEVFELRELFEQWLSAGNNVITDASVSIPIAFHIIRFNDGSADVTDSQILAQLNTLNYFFGNTSFSFTLHSIQRINNTSWTMHNPFSQEEIQMKQNLAIDPANVLNFYTCAFSPGSTLGGYAYFPWQYPENSFMHGVVVRNTTLPQSPPPSNSLGHVAVHEVGHFVGLFHTFQNGCVYPGDDVDDTPYEATPAYGCPIGRNSCPDPEPDPIHNFMDYTDDACKDHFTPGQATRMDEKMSQYRPSMYFTDVQVSVDQIRESGQLMTGTIVSHWQGNSFVNYTVPIPSFNFLTNTNEVFRGWQGIIENPHEKYNRWKGNNIDDPDVRNHHIFTISSDITYYTSQFKKTHSGVTLKNVLEGSTTLTNNNIDYIQFKDPWLIDFPDPQFGNSLRNRGMDAPFKNLGSPFTFTYNSAYKGVFLNQNPTFDPNLPLYSVKFDYEQDIFINQTGQTHRFYLRNWSGTGVDIQYPYSLETPVVFLNSNAVVNANLKGTQLSNQTDAFNPNSQRKAVRLFNGTLASIYKSMGNIWIDRSYDNGQTWNLWSAGIPFSDAFENFTPSIVEIPWNEPHSFAAVVYSTDINIKLHIIRTNNSVNYYSPGEFVNWDNETMSLPITPVVAVTQNRILMVCNGAINSNGQKGLAYFYGTISRSGNNVYISWSDGHFPPDFKIIPGTTQNSKNPSIVADKNAGNIFHITWQEGNIIKYCKATGGSNSLSFDNVETVSESNIFSINTNPSISLANGNPVVSWTGSGTPVADKIAAKDNFGEQQTPRIVVRRKGSSWGDLQIAGKDVNYTNNNSASSITEKTVIVWSEGSTSPQSKWMKRTSGNYSTPRNLSHWGIHTQVIGGSDYENMTSIV